jgi:hypothetical protein
MTSKSHPKLIRYNQPCLKQVPVSGSKTRPVAPYPRQSKQFGGATTYPLVKTGAGMDFASQLQAYESMARHKFLTIFNARSFAELPRWLNQMLEKSLIPGLHRIGFDETIAKMIFQLAPSSWQLMGPVNAKIIAFQPGINQEIEEVRQGLLLKAAQNDDRNLRFAAALPAPIAGTLQDNMSLENLLDLLDDIATPWIILPRALRFLEKDQCRYLPVYLKIIDLETCEACLKLFSRIAAEFAGNYALKFAGRRHPPDQLTQLLFYGYSALFWKTLRCPPANLENSAVFDIFFNWINRLARKSKFLGKEEIRSIDRMKKMKSTAFPIRNFRRPPNHGQPDYSWFAVTLRHGHLGMTAILKYFGVDQLLESRQTGHRRPEPSIQSDLPILLDWIQTHYHSESKKTRGYIRQLTGCLKSAYGLIQHDHNRIAREFLNRRFNNLQILFSK